MRKIVLFFGLVSIFTSNLFSQKFDYDGSFEKLNHLRLNTLKKGIVGKKYYYDFTKVANCNKTWICYLGLIKSKANKFYKILICFYVHGLSCRGTSQILIYDLQNNFIGYYFVAMPSDLPDKILDNKLFYSQYNSNCKFRKGTIISFENGLPKNIFIPCDNAKTGDYYSFTEKE